MRHVSIDIEACGEVLLSVGACDFDPHTGKTGDEYYGVLQVQPQLDMGLQMDGKAWEWWLRQANAARMALNNPMDPMTVLHDLSRFLAGDCWLWAYPTSFDLPIIERVCRKYDVRIPWKWVNTLDGRTLWRLACSLDPGCTRLEKNAYNDHDAMHDARQQARWYATYLSSVLKGIELVPDYQPPQEVK